MLYFEIYYGHCALGRYYEIQNPQVDFHVDSLFFFSLLVTQFLFLIYHNYVSFE